MKRWQAFIQPSRDQSSRRPAALLFGYVALAAPVALLGFATGLVWRVTLPVASGCVLVGLLRAGRARLELVNRRRVADVLLRTGVKVHPHSDLLVWRSTELVSVRNRTTLARSLDRIAADLERPSFASAVPLDRHGLRPQLSLIHSLSARLAQLDRPVAPGGMVLVEDLLTDGYSSPLYVGGACSEPAVALERCLHALESAGSSDRPVVTPPPELSGSAGAMRRRPDGARAHSGGGLR